MKENKKHDLSYAATKEYKYFLNEPEGEGLVFFSSEKARTDYFNDVLIDEYMDGDEWNDEDIRYVCAGVVTHKPRKVNIKKRPPDDEIDEEGFDEDDDYWSGGINESYDYELKPYDDQPEDNAAKIKAHEQLLRKLLDEMSGTITPEIKREIAELLGEEKE